MPRYTIGSISGCHINPAVTVGLWIAGKTRADEIPWYVGGQVVGGLVGGLTIFLIANSVSGFRREGDGVRVERFRLALAVSVAWRPRRFRNGRGDRD